jgi:hypothetical protein
VQPVGTFERDCLHGSLIAQIHPRFNSTI